MPGNQDRFIRAVPAVPVAAPPPVATTDPVAQAFPAAAAANAKAMVAKEKREALKALATAAGIDRNRRKRKI